MSPPAAPAPGDERLESVFSGCRRRDRARWAVLAIVLGVLAISLAFADAFNLPRYRDAASTVLHLVADSMPPDFTRAAGWLRPLAETVAMSIAATVCGALVALPLALVAARNSGVLPRLSVPARMLLGAARSVPELIFGVIFVAALGFGPLAGVFALTFHSVGMLGKFMAEYVEHLEPAPVQALESYGLSRAGVIRYGLLPQVLPRLLDVTLYRWEHNVRAASVMGMVGAGGLGLELVTAFSLFEYREAMAILIVIFAVVVTIDALSAAVRKRALPR